MSVGSTLVGGDADIGGTLTVGRVLANGTDISSEFDHLQNITDTNAARIAHLLDEIASLEQRCGCATGTTGTTGSAEPCSFPVGSWDAPPPYQTILAVAVKCCSECASDNQCVAWTHVNETNECQLYDDLYADTLVTGLTDRVSGKPGVTACEDCFNSVVSTSTAGAAATTGTASTGPVGCGTPPYVAYGSASSNAAVPDGGNVTYTCSCAYRVVGSATIRCVHGLFQPAPPTCAGITVLSATAYTGTLHTGINSGKGQFAVSPNGTYGYLVVPSVMEGYIQTRLSDMSTSTFQAGTNVTAYTHAALDRSGAYLYVPQDDNMVGRFVVNKTTPTLITVPLAGVLSVREVFVPTTPASLSAGHVWFGVHFQGANAPVGVVKAAYAEWPNVNTTRFDDGDLDIRCMSSNGTHAFVCVVTATGPHKIVVMDIDSFTVVQQIWTAVLPESIAFDHEGKFMYVSGEYQGSEWIFEIDLQTGNSTGRSLLVGSTHTILTHPDPALPFLYAVAIDGVHQICLSTFEYGRDVFFSPSYRPTTTATMDATGTIYAAAMDVVAVIQIAP